MSEAGKPGPTPERLMQMAWAFAPPLAIEAALRNRVFDVLDAGPKTLQQISIETGASTRGLAAVMNLLVSLNLLEKTGQTYQLTPESAAFLVTSQPGYQGGIFRHISTQLLPRFLSLTEVVKTGKPATDVSDASQGQEFFTQLVEDIFPMSYQPARALARELNLGSIQEPVSVLDIAAGSGVWGIALAQSSPNVRITAVDWPDVLPVTQKIVARFGLEDRLTLVAGDILEADFGSGHRVATLGHILHSEGQERSRELLKRVFAALAPGGTIAIAEFLVNNDRTGPVPAVIFAVNMLVNTKEGDTYSFEEISTWLTDCGFRNVRTLEARGPSPLILADKP